MIGTSTRIRNRALAPGLPSVVTGDLLLYDQGTVYVWDKSDGSEIRTFSSTGYAAIQLPSDNIFVVDPTNNKIRKHDQEGNVLATLSLSVSDTEEPQQIPGSSAFWVPGTGSPRDLHLVQEDLTYQTYTLSRSGGWMGLEVNGNGDAAVQHDAGGNNHYVEVVDNSASFVGEFNRGTTVYDGGGIEIFDDRSVAFCYEDGNVDQQITYYSYDGGGSWTQQWETLLGSGTDVGGDHAHGLPNGDNHILVGRRTDVIEKYARVASGGYAAGDLMGSYSAPASTYGSIQAEMDDAGDTYWSWHSQHIIKIAPDLTEQWITSIGFYATNVNPSPCGTDGLS